LLTVCPSWGIHGGILGDRKEPQTLQSTKGSGTLVANDEDAADRGDYEIVIAEDDPFTLALVREALERDGFRVVAEARDADEAVEAALRHRPHVLLVEVDLPGGGIAACQAILAQIRDARIAMLAGYSADDDVLRAIDAGADGYLLTSTAQGRMPSALRAVARGETALPRAATARLVREVRAARSIQQTPQRVRTNRSLLYFPRFLKHYYRRLRSGMPASAAWASARARMQAYR
jgi:DNA-binding NarL/FixJ family response regulator